MTKSSDVYKAEFVEKPDGKDESWKAGRVPVVLEVAPEVKSRLEAIARQAKMSVSQAGGIILEAQVDKHVKLETSLRNMVEMALNEELGRIEEQLLLFRSVTTGKKNVSN